MDDLGRRQRVTLQDLIHARPFEHALAISPRQPPPPDPLAEPSQSPAVAADAVVGIVAPHHCRQMVESISFLIFISASRTIGPHRSMIDCEHIESRIATFIRIPTIDLKPSESRACHRRRPGFCRTRPCVGRKPESCHGARRYERTALHLVRISAIYRPSREPSAESMFEQVVGSPPVLW